jgi:hypothetical protein
LTGGIVVSDFLGTDECRELKRQLELAQLFTFLGDCETIVPSDFDLSSFTDNIGGIVVYQNRVYQKSDVEQLLSSQLVSVANGVWNALG